MWWTTNHLADQCEDLLDILDFTCGDMYQYVPLFDQSVAHNKKDSDGLMVSGIQVKWGGKQRTLRNSKMTKGCIGPYRALMFLRKSDAKWVRGDANGEKIVVDCTLSVGEVQSATFGRYIYWDATACQLVAEGTRDAEKIPVPPWYDLSAEANDRAMTPDEQAREQTKR